MYAALGETGASNGKRIDRDTIANRFGYSVALRRIICVRELVEMMKFLGSAVVGLIAWAVAQYISAAIAIGVSAFMFDQMHIRNYDKLNDKFDTRHEAG